MLAWTGKDRDGPKTDLFGIDMDVKINPMVTPIRCISP